VGDAHPTIKNFCSDSVTQSANHPFLYFPQRILRSFFHTAARKKFPGQPEEFYKQLRKPIRSGAEKAVDDNGNPDPESFYHNRYFINVKSKYQPQIVNIHNEPITDPNDIYGGCVVRAYSGFYYCAIVRLRRF